MKASKIQLTSIEDASRRFDPSYHLSDAIVVKKGQRNNLRDSIFKHII